MSEDSLKIEKGNKNMDIMENKNQCTSVIKFTDDCIENYCSFRCQLEEGHKGKHIDNGIKYPPLKKGHIYKLEWDDNNFD
jgi:hypothetical protein